MLVAAAIVLLSLPEPRTVVLSQGMDVTPYAGAAYRYWAETDTTLDSASPAESFGADTVLAGGPARTILIRFGDLERVLGPRAKIIKADLGLTQVQPGDADLVRAGQMLVGWEPGPMHSLLSLVASPGQRAALEKEQSEGAATWKDRMAGAHAVAWQTPGALGALDSKALTGMSASIDSHGNETIHGLEACLQAAADHWDENDGIALTFAQPVGFFSGRADQGHPTLTLEVVNEPAEKGPDLAVTAIQESADGSTFTGEVANLGDAASEGASAHWILDGVAQAAKPVGAPAAGKTESVELQMPAWKPGERHEVELSLLPAGPDSDSNDDRLAIRSDAIPVSVAIDPAFQAQVEKDYGSVQDWLQMEFRVWNDVYCPGSRFAFAPNGVTSRIRLQPMATAGQASVARAVLTAEDAKAEDPGTPLLRAIGRALGLPDLSATNLTADKVKLAGAEGQTCVDRFPGLMGGGDTRNDCMLLPDKNLENDPIDLELSAESPLPASGLFSATSVAVLNGLDAGPVPAVSPALKGVPPVILLQVHNRSGVPLAGLPLQIYGMANGEFSAQPKTVKTSADGNALLPSAPFGTIDGSFGSAAIYVSASLNGETDGRFIKLYEVLDAARRGGKSALVYDVELELPSDPVDRTSDLAEGHGMTTTDGVAVPGCAAATDGSDASVSDLTIPPGGYVDIDMRRDRPISEVQITPGTGGFLPQFDVVLYGTGESASAAKPWAREFDFPWTIANRPAKDPEGKACAAYRGQTLTARFVRIVNRSKMSAAHLAEIRVFAAKAVTNR